MMNIRNDTHKEYLSHPILLPEPTLFTIACFYVYHSILCMGTQFGQSATQLKYQSEKEME